VKANDLINKHKSNGDNHPIRCSFLWQFSILFYRYLLQFFATFEKGLAGIVGWIILGLVLGILYPSYNPSEVLQSSYLISLSTGMLGAVSALDIFGSDFRFFEREYIVGLSKFAYFLSKNLLDSLYCIVHPAVFLAIYYYLSDPGAPFANYYSILIATQFACRSFGHIWSIIFRNPAVAQMITLLSILLFNLICGFNPSISTMRTYPFFGLFIPEISYARWTYEALCTIELDSYPPIFLNANNLLKESVGLGNSVSLCVGILFVFAIAIRTSALLYLLWKYWIPTRKFNQKQNGENSINLVRL